MYLIYANRSLYFLCSSSREKFSGIGPGLLFKFVWMVVDGDLRAHLLPYLLISRLTSPDNTASQRPWSCPCHLGGPMTPEIDSFLWLSCSGFGRLLACHMPDPERRCFRTRYSSDIFVIAFALYQLENTILARKA